MYGRTAVTISLLASRPLSEAEADRLIRGMLSEIGSTQESLGNQQVHGPVTIEQREVLSDE